MTPDTLAARGERIEVASAAGLRRWLAPPFTALILLVHPLVSLLNPGGQLADPGTGWHLVSGRYILATHSIPDRDLFSYTAVGHPWITYCWLFESTGAFLERVGGLPLFASVCMLIYAFVPVVLYRRMLRMGVGILPALVCTLLAYLVLTSHALARPHVVTYLLFVVFLGRIDDVYAGRRAARALWILPPLAILWANVHGGFVTALALVGIYAAVAGMRAVVFRDRAEGRLAFLFGILILAIAAATLVNPNGPRLHAEIFHHLGMKTTKYFDEFRSPDFQAPSAPIFFFEVLVLASIVTAAFARQRLAWVEVALLLFFLHEALHSVRNMNFFALVAAPIVGRELTVALKARWPTFHRRWQQIAEEQAALRSSLVYLPALCALFVGLAVAGKFGFPATLDNDSQLTRGAADFIAAHKGRFARPFNTDNMGGPIIYRFWPDLRVFVDDRIDVYGDDFVENSYLSVLWGRPEWRDPLARWDIDSAIVASGTPCAALLRESADWDLQYEDGKSLIFFRSAVTRPSS